MRRIEARWMISGGWVGGTVAGAGAAAVTAARSEPLICETGLRPSMVAMTLGMVYMLIAMQLLQ